MADFEAGPVKIDIEAGKVIVAAAYEHEMGKAEAKISVDAVAIIKAIVASTENEVDDLIAAPIIGMLMAADDGDAEEAPAEVAE
jgi:hypothetical protein